jgi:ribA/ribD-fused uncharacterized protein
MNEEYYFFWSETPFSQWARSKFIVDGITYNCAEQYMMAAKARMFGDKDKEADIMEATHPREQKQLGRQVKGFHSERWDNVARDVVYEGNKAKFTQNKRMKEQLLETHPKILVEASPYDKIWGIGLSAKDAQNTPPDSWPGKNWLGEVLTNLRDDLK